MRLDGVVVRTVGELRKALRGVPADTPIAKLDDNDFMYDLKVYAEDDWIEVGTTGRFVPNPRGLKPELLEVSKYEREHYVNDEKRDGPRVRGILV